MKFSKPWVIFVAGLMLAASPFFSGCQSGAKMDSAPAATALADTEISLRKDSVEVEAQSLPAPQYTMVEAGDSKLLARAFYDAPPMIPHSIDNISQSKEDNECLSCHDEADEETPGIPPSHRNHLLWLVLTGGARLWLRLKVTLDQKFEWKRLVPRLLLER